MSEGGVKYKQDVTQLLLYAIAKHLEDVEPIPFWLTGKARQSEGNPSRIELVVPDDWVKNIKGYQDMQDVYVAIRIPRECLQAYERMRLTTAAPRQNEGNEPVVGDVTQVSPIQPS